MNGKTYSPDKYTLYLSQKPIFKRISCGNIHEDENGLISFELRVRYYGAEEFRMKYFTEYSTTYQSTTVTEPFYAKIPFTGYEPDEHIYIDLSATNEYGTVYGSKTILPERLLLQKDDPEFELDLEFTFNNTNHEINEKLEYNYIEVYNINFECVADGRYYQDVIRYLSPGTYYVWYYNNGIIVLKKTVVIN